MKKLFLALALSAAACLAGCSDNEEIGYDIGSKVLIPKNGLQQVALTADAAAIDYEVWIYRSGYNEGGSTAALSVDAEALAAYNKANGTAYVLMPEACYDLRPPPCGSTTTPTPRRSAFGSTSRRSRRTVAACCPFRSAVPTRR